MRIFLRMVLCIVIVFVCGLTSPFTTCAQSPIGFWQTIDDNTGEPRSIVEIYEEEETVKGRIVQLINPDEPNPLCDKCKGKRKDQPVEGMVILENMSQDGSEWAGGKILDPENGKSYRCRIWIEDGTLQVRGYLAVFHRTQTWLPAEDPSSGR